MEPRRTSARLAAMTTARRSILVLALAAMVLACGGGSSAGAPSGPASPVAVPSFPAFPDGQPANVTPTPGTLNPRDVGASRIDAALDGRRLFVRLIWWSGVEPCNVLDSVVLRRDGSNLHLTIREGATDLDAICIELAMLKSTIVDLGELEPGTYAVSAFGEADPVTVTVG